MAERIEMNNSERQRRVPGASGIIFFSNEVLQQIDTALDLLLEESKAKCAVVIDRTGCILSSGGDFYPIAHETMGAVAAGVIAALNTLVSRASSPEVSVKFYGGDVDKVHFMVVADRLILCMLHSRQVTSGQIRTAAKTFAQTVKNTIDTTRNDGTDADELARSVQFIESKLNDMFKEFL
jgi:predicted regulator of Ras-like GTPase activity (Roadblock/LC7/MglB family)